MPPLSLLLALVPASPTPLRPAPVPTAVAYLVEFFLRLKCMEHEVEGSRPRGRPKKTCKEVVREDCQAGKLNKEDAMDRCKWRKVIKEAR